MAPSWPAPRATSPILVATAKQVIEIIQGAGRLLTMFAPLQKGPRLASKAPSSMPRAARGRGLQHSEWAFAPLGHGQARALFVQSKVETARRHDTVGLADSPCPRRRR